MPNKIINKTQTIAIYTMVAAATLALALSGHIPTTISGLLGILVAASWLWEKRKQQTSPAWRWNSLVLLSLCGALVFGIATANIVGAASLFLSALLIVKLFQRKTTKDNKQIILLAFLIIVAASALNSNINYALCFAIFIFSATLSTICTTVQTEGKDFTFTLADRKALLATVLRGSVVMLTIATAIFFTFPRLGFGFLVGLQPPSLGITGFSDQITLGHHGTLSEDNRVIMRVGLPKDSTVSVENIHWRGVAFDHYENREWSRSEQAPKTQKDILVDTAGVSQETILYHPHQRKQRIKQRLGENLQQDIYLEATGYDVLFGASFPASFSVRRGKTIRLTENNDEIRMRYGVRTRYSVLSQIGGATAPHGTEVPASLVYTQLPGSLSAKLLPLAQQMTRGKRTTADKAAAIEQHLQQTFTYTKNLTAPPENIDPVLFFLTSSQRGHCEYFASAMVLLLRSLGIASRNVNGFLGGEWNEYESYVAVRMKNAHSWVEVYDPTFGWKTYDPTPSSLSADNTVVARDTATQRMRRYLDSLRFRWNQWVIEYDQKKQASLLSEISQTIKVMAKTIKQSFIDLDYSRMGLWILPGVLLFIILYIRHKRPHKRTGATAISPNAKKVHSTYHKTLGFVQKVAEAKAHHQTPLQYAQTVLSLKVPGADDFHSLTLLYYQSRYGDKTTMEQVTRAQLLRKKIQRSHKH